ncbi:MAG: NAD(P)H-binding protein [Pseudomonas sp.]
MHISVLGATGGTGRTIVEQALAAGHHVSALVRRPQAFPLAHARLRVVVGDARDRQVIETLVEGADGIVSSLGLPAAGTTRAEIDDSEKVDVCVVSTRLLFEAMPRHGVRRIVLMSTHGAGGSQDGSEYVRWLRDLVRNRVHDKDDMEAFIAASDAPVDWTVIRNPAIYDGPAGRPHEVYTKITLNRSSRITYADLAAFTLSELQAPRHIGQFLTITEPQDDAALMRAATVAPVCA